jgi:hypothetical protein
MNGRLNTQVDEISSVIAMINLEEEAICLIIKRFLPSFLPSFLSSSFGMMTLPLGLVTYTHLIK